MKAVVLHAPGDLRVDTHPEMASPGAGEVRVRMARGGICGSDLHYYRHGGFGAVRLREPMALGHEVSGVVEAIGEGVEAVTPGDRVALNPSLPCGDCGFCRNGQRNQCADMRFSGSAMRFPHQQGLFREGVTLPAAQVVRLHPDTDLGAAACAEPLAVCLHAVAGAGSLLGRRVLVTGAGPIGCLTVLAARLAGAGEIVVTDLAPEPLAIARAMGADAAHDLATDPGALEHLKAARGQVDVMFDCTGAAPALVAGCEALRPGGQLVAVGMGNEAALPMSLIVTKELRLSGSFRFDAEFATAAALIDAGRVDLAPLITTTLPLDQVVEAFDLAGDRARAMKVQISF